MKIFSLLIIGATISYNAIGAQEKQREVQKECLDAFKVVKSELEMHKSIVFDTSQIVLNNGLIIYHFFHDTVTSVCLTDSKQTAELSNKFISISAKGLPVVISNGNQSVVVH